MRFTSLRLARSAGMLNLYAIKRFPSAGPIRPCSSISSMLNFIFSRACKLTLGGIIAGAQARPAPEIKNTTKMLQQLIRMIGIHRAKFLPVIKKNGAPAESPTPCKSKEGWCPFLFQLKVMLHSGSIGCSHIQFIAGTITKINCGEYTIVRNIHYTHNRNVAPVKAFPFECYCLGDL
jgi:hypothetical protein